MTQLTYKLFQIKLERSDYDLINELGREAAYKAYPKFEASEMMMLAGPEAFVPEWAEYYTQVSDIAIVGGETNMERLEQAFYTHNNPRGSQELEDRITRYAPQHSMSIGDIVVTEEGRVFMVDRAGFLEMPIEPTSLGLDTLEAA